MTVQFVPVVPSQPAASSADLVPRRSLWLRSLTSKLVAGVVVLVLVLVVAIGGATNYFLQNFLINKLDQQVQSNAVQTGQFVERCVESNGFCNSGSLPTPLHEWIYILPKNGRTFRTSLDNVSTLKLTPAQTRAFRDDPGQIMVVHQDGKELHVSATVTHSLGLIVVSGLSDDDARSTLHRLLRLELLIGAAAVAIAIGATTWGVRRSLRNLYKVTGTAREVTAELSPEGAGLDRRVPVVEEGTEIGQLAESVNTLLAAVESQFASRVESERRMRQFLADASHELRTPLTSIRGFAELARMQRAVGDNEDDNLHRIESEGTRMSRLVEDLLLLARGDDIENAHPRADEPIDLASMADDVVAAARAGYPDRRIDLQIVPVPPVRGDRDQLFRVLRNLVTNACVHTAPERPMLVRTFPDAGQVVVQVIDGGPGLPPEEAAHVFERFWRADKARTRARGGSGLGMSIVATLVRAHGGSVIFDSTVETGSTVTVRLPAAGQAALSAD